MLMAGGCLRLPPMKVQR